MSICYIDVHTDEFKTIYNVKSLKAALTFTAIDIEFVLEDDNKVLIQVKAFQVER